MPWQNPASPAAGLRPTAIAYRAHARNAAASSAARVHKAPLRTAPIIMVHPVFHRGANPNTWNHDPNHALCIGRDAGRPLVSGQCVSRWRRHFFSRKLPDGPLRSAPVRLGPGCSELFDGTPASTPDQTGGIAVLPGARALTSSRT